MCDGSWALVDEGTFDETKLVDLQARLYRLIKEERISVFNQYVPSDSTYVREVRSLKREIRVLLLNRKWLGDHHGRFYVRDLEEWHLYAHPKKRG